MPPKKKRGSATKGATTKPKTTVKSPNQNVTKKPEIKKPFVPKFTEIITRSKGRGKKQVEAPPNESASSTSDEGVSETESKTELETTPLKPELENSLSVDPEVPKSQEEKIPKSEEHSVSMDTDDSQDEYLNMQEQEAIISEQLSNLEFEMSKVEVIKTHRIDLEEKAETEKEQVEFIDTFESEIIIECVSDEVIPIAGEQEICVDSEVFEFQEITAEKEIENKLNQEEIDTKIIEDISKIQLEKTGPSEEVERKISKESEKIEIEEQQNEEYKKIEAKEEEFKEIDETQYNFQEENEDQMDYTEDSNEVELNEKSEKEDTESAHTESTKSKLPKQKTAPKKQKPKLKQLKKKPEKPSSLTPESIVRRSSRIKSINVQKQKSKGHGLVKHKEESQEQAISVEEKPTPPEEPKFVAPTEQQKPVKVKSRWRRSSELEQSSNLNNKPANTPELVVNEPKVETDESTQKNEEEVQKRLKQFVHLKENLYLTERVSCKEAKKMTCDCFLTEEEIATGDFGCGEDCLNRLLMIECGGLCPVGDRCTNKRFQKGEFAPCEVFCTEKKGLGIRAAANIPYGEFILEYVGEVLDPEEFEKRATEYSSDKNQHYYFMALRADAVIDATQKGNISRFINHSCDPNAETQKWTVNGELRIGFFSKRTILAGEEITFDYQFQRYGKEAQKCYCEASTCRGWLGEEPDDDDEDEEDEEDEEEEEEEELEEESKVIVEKKDDEKLEEAVETPEVPEEKTEVTGEPEPEIKKEKVVKKKEKKKILRSRMPRKDIFEDQDLDEEIETLQTTGLKNQAQTLKLSRLMVRAKEPAQRTKLLRVLRRGELPCRRLFLDYHGLRLIHGWMTDAQHMAKQNKKLESLRLEILQTLATLPIPNKTMLQDSKVLLTVQWWSKKIDEGATLDSDSNSPKVELENEIKMEKSPVETPDEPFGTKANAELPTKSIEEFRAALQEDMEISPVPFEDKESNDSKTTSTEEMLPDYETEIVALGLKLLDEWSILKEVFRIPKKERIEQMKEHEREADRKYRAGLGLEQDLEKKYESRYGTIFKRHKKKRDSSKDPKTKDDQMTMFEKYHRRKLFALQFEQQELERRRKQQEIWRQHEQRCMTMGTDPKFTAPFDPNQGLRSTMIWNPQTSQWQNYPLPLSNISGNHPSHIPGHIPSNLPTNLQNNNLSANHPTTITSSGVYHYPAVNQNLLPSPMQPQPSHLNNAQIAINRLIQTPPPNIQNKPLYNQQPQPMQYRPNVPVGMAFNVPQPQHVLPNLPSPMNPQNPMYPPQNEQHMANYHSGQNGNMMQQHMVAKQPPLPTLPYQENIKAQEDLSQVKFMGPIPPPVKLPPKWKCAKDKYGRPYYYHIRFRKAQWEPPELPPEDPDETSESSSSDTSSLSSDTSTDESDSDDDIDDARLLLQIKNKFKMMEANKAEQDVEDDVQEDAGKAVKNTEKDMSLDSRLLEELALLKEETPPPTKRRRVGLVTEILISPRTEEDKLQFKEDVKRYKANKEKLKRQKEMLELSKKQLAGKSVKPPTARSYKKHKISVKAKLKEMTDNDAAKKIKEAFRSGMAVVMVSILNPYRKPDCKEGRITNTEDFKHLARKLTHFVMLKELKHCQNIEDLIVTESVKSKAKEFVRKYMSKFGETYQKPKDEPDFL